MLQIGISGDIGSFSEEAGLIYAAKAHGNQYNLNYLIDMDGVLKGLTDNTIDVGVFPFVNYNSGIVWPAFAAMGKYNFIPIDDVELNVEQCLITREEVNLTDINELYSFTPAFEQCKIFINQNNLKLIDWGDTAKAARDLADGILPKNSGVIASSNAAIKYGLKIL